MIVNLNKRISIESLRRHLFPEDSISEHAVFLFAKAKGTSLIVEDYRLLFEGDFDIQSSYHIQIKSETIGELIKKAHDTGTTLIEIHSHIDQNRAKFSYTDWSGFSDFVPHIIWRLPKRPYAALVFADDSVDGLYWLEEIENPKQRDGGTDGKSSIYATGLSLKNEGGYYE